MNLADGFRSRRVLVTGLTGFKGLWLGLWLKRLGADVLGLALPPTAEMSAAWPDQRRHFPCQHVDVCDAAMVMRTVDEFQPEIIFHLAAQPLVRLSYEQPVQTFAANVLGVVHVLESARCVSSVKAVVVVTTDKCYANREWRWGYREDDSLGGHDPYSTSKACAELVTSCYRQAYAATRPELHLATARAGNVIGGGDWALDRLVPDIVRMLKVGQPVPIRNPRAIRPWQHVVEPLAGYLMLGASLVSRGASFASAWNFGPSDEVPVTVGVMARKMIRAWGEGKLLESDVAPSASTHEAHFLKLDSSKAIAELGWKPLLSIDERIDWTVAWYKACRDDPGRSWDMAEQQIEAAQQRVAELHRAQLGDFASFESQDQHRLAS